MITKGFNIMKRIANLIPLFVVSCAGLLSVLIIVLFATKDHYDPKITSHSEYELADVKIEEIIKEADTIVIGKYVGTDVTEKLYVHHFDIKEQYHGVRCAASIEVYADIVPEDQEQFQFDEAYFSPGHEYLLLLNRNDSVLYPELRYYMVGDVRLDLTSGDYSLGGKTVELPFDLPLADYVLSYVDQPGIIEPEEKTYGNAINELIGESDYVAFIIVDDLLVEGINGPTNTYYCSIEKELGQTPVSQKMEDGRILLVLRKDQVEIGETYIIGFDAIDDVSVIYIQSTETSIYKYSEALEEEIANRAKWNVK